MTKQTASTDVRVGDVVVIAPTNPADITVEPAHMRLHRVVEVTPTNIITTDVRERWWTWDVAASGHHFWGYGSHPYTASLWGIRPPSLQEKAAFDARAQVGACHDAALAYADATRERDRLRARLAEQEETVALAWEEHVVTVRACRDALANSAAQHGITLDEYTAPPDPDESFDPHRVVEALTLLVGS